MGERATSAGSADRFLGDVALRWARPAGFVGVVALVAAALTLTKGDEQAATRFYHAYLVSFAFYLSLALGALFFVLLQHLTRSGWSVVLRRLAECVAANMLLLAVLAVPLVPGIHHLYHWSHAEAVAGDHLLHGKQPYLNLPFFIGRLAGYFLVWILLARYFLRTSVRQDESGDPALTVKMHRVSAPAMVLFGITTTFAAFDLLMSLDPHWYSTIFGVYYFSGAAVGFFALLAVMVVLVQRAGRLSAEITREHYQDLGKLIFAFVVFWAYIAFSQYMLIWYANIPEETVWYLRRQSGDWSAVGLALLFGHFVVPFILLISRGPKRQPAVLALAAVWVLAMHWLDMYWLVMPQIGSPSAKPVLVDLLCLVGLGGILTAATAWRLRRQALLPVRDPRLPESLAFENV